MHKHLWKNEKNNKFSQLEDLMKNRNYSIFNGHDHSFSTKIINDQIYTTLSTTGGSQNSSNSNVFDQITLISMRDRPYTTHLKLNEILNYWSKLKFEVIQSLLPQTQGMNFRKNETHL